MKVLGIGYGRHLFNQNNFEFKRLQRCAGEVVSFDQIIFAKKTDELQTLKAGNNFTVHSTESLSKLTMIFDAVKIGSKIIKENKIDTITTQDLFETGLVGFILKRRFPHITLQVQEHGDVLSLPYWREEKFSNQIRYYFAKYLLKQADIVRVVSDRTVEYLRTFLSSKKIIRKCPVVIDTSKFVQTESEMTDRSSKKFVFITAARFVPQKNLPLMLKAFVNVYASEPKARLIIFGSGPDRSKIFDLIKELRLSKIVEVKNWTNNLSDEMKKADAYLLTSNYEGWGRVLIEAMVQGLPVVTTDVGCANEVVKHREHGLVVPVNDEKSLINAMKELIINKNLYRSIVENLNHLDISTIPGTDVESYATEWVKTLR